MKIIIILCLCFSLILSEDNKQQLYGKFYFNSAIRNNHFQNKLGRKYKRAYYSGSSGFTSFYKQNNNIHKNNGVVNSGTTPHSRYPQYTYFNRHTFSSDFAFYCGDEKMKYEVDPNRSDKDTLVIGVAVNLNYGALKNLIITLRKTGYKGKIIIMKHMNNDDNYNYDKYNVKIIKLQQTYPYYPSDEPDYPIPNNVIRSMPKLPRKSFFYWHTVRFLLLDIFFKTHYKKFTFIHTLDMRDSIFQINPFHWNYPSKCVFVFEESRRFTIKSNRYTNDWANGYGAPKEMYVNTNINVGNLFGSSKELSDFVSGFCKEIKQNPSIIEKTSEQMVINAFYYLHNKFSYPVYFSRNEMGMARNFCQDLERDQSSFYPDSVIHLVRNIDGSIPCILHQYPTAIRLPPPERSKEFIKVLQNCLKPHQPYDSLSMKKNVYNLK